MSVVKDFTYGKIFGIFIGIFFGIESIQILFKWSFFVL